MFSRARWRLTLWFAGALALVLLLTGAAVYLTARASLFDQVNDDLEARAGREMRPLAARLLERLGGGGSPRDVAIGPAFTAGGYFYALVNADGELLAGTPNVDPTGLAPAAALTKAGGNEPTFADTDSSEGEELRVYIVPLEGPRGRQFFLEVGRSIEPELQALRRLLLILLIGAGLGFALALSGGYFLAGRALRPIQAAMHRQRAFVADASHELRTPLAVIRANAELLARHPPKRARDTAASLDDIIQETDRLSGLVGQLLTLAQADAGQFPLWLTDLDLANLAGDSARQMRLLAEPKSIAIDVQASGPLTVRGDAARLRELLMILLDNAIKYSDSGASVQVQVLPVDGSARLQVSDSGRGIPPEALPRIFDRFYRVDKARSREMGGSGLGLAIAKWIVDSHGGTIRIDSQVGKGTTVTVELPLAPTD